MAEGVETPEQNSWLQEHGCDQVQGFYHQRPVPLDEFLAIVADRAR
ncbi:MAG: EAL domain-containing protein [Pseudomonadota bacterium]